MSNFNCVLVTCFRIFNNLDKVFDAPTIVTGLIPRPSSKWEYLVVRAPRDRCDAKGWGSHMVSNGALKTSFDSYSHI
jgi:hypothetical protein